MAFRIPMPRRGLKSFTIGFILLLTPLIFLQRLSTLDLSDNNPLQLIPKPSWGLYQGSPDESSNIANKGNSHLTVDGEEYETVTSNRRHRHRRRKADVQVPVKVNGEQNGQLPQHRYLDNGLVEVNPAGQHPIYDLIERGKRAWEEKQAKGSKTLREAVNEYRRRYNRSPPRGFDKWWAYVQKHNVQLPDEYDQIHKDLEPFFAFPPKELVHHLQIAQKLSGMYTITCQSGSCDYNLTLEGLNEEGERVARERAKAQMSLIEDIQGELEDVEAVFYSHDGPWQFVDHGYKGALEDAASVGEYMTKEDHDHDSTHLGWASACAPHKPLREEYNPDVLPNLDSTWKGEKSFIWDHKTSMDPCNHPTLTHTVGYLSGHGKGPGPSKDLYPVMAMCKTALHSDVLAVSMEAWTEDVGDDPVWEEKTDDRMLWRGTTTGIYFRDGVPWNISQRANLVDYTARNQGDLPILPPTPTDQSVGTANLIELSTLNSDLVDVGFVDKPIQCDPGVCEELSAYYHFTDRIDWKKGNSYKYLLDIDGNGWSARFKRLMTTNSMILKSTIFPEWYTDRVQPWVHYVPLKSDLTDLYDVLTFFRGNDGLAKKIAEDGKEWSLKYWRKEDMVAYQYRLFLELARLQSSNREASTYDNLVEK